jgi:hypothetical protein
LPLILLFRGEPVDTSEDPVDTSEGLFFRSGGRKDASEELPDD